MERMVEARMLSRGYEVFGEKSSVFGEVAKGWKVV